MIEETFNTPAQYFGYNDTSILKFDSDSTETVLNWIKNHPASNEVSWLNFHSIYNKKDIETVSKIVGMHAMSLEDIYTEIIFFKYTYCHSEI